MPDMKHVTTPMPYANSGDFHRIFNEEKDDLYQLSFLLTADHEKARQCFVSGLEDAVSGNSVFKEWARSWARRVIIQNAVRVISPRRLIEKCEENAPPSFDSNGEMRAVEGAEIADILDLEPLERFVFVMSALEHYSEHECSILLGCPRRDVIGARVRGLQRLRSATELRPGYQVNVSSEKPGLHDNCRSAVEDFLHV